MSDSSNQPVSGTQRRPGISRRVAVIVAALAIIGLIVEIVLDVGPAQIVLHIAILVIAIVTVSIAWRRYDDKPS